MKQKTVKKYQNQCFKPNLFGENDSYQFKASKLGLVMIFFGAVFALTYFYTLVDQMLSFQNDRYLTSTNAIDLSKDNDYDMSQQIFMPMIDIFKYSSLQTFNHDIFQDENPSKIDLQKLSRYFTITNVVRYRNSNNKSQWYHSKYIHCTQEDLEKRQMTGADLLKGQLSLCPNMIEMKNYLRLKNNYNHVERTSVNIEFIYCNSNKQSDCKTAQEIEDLFLKTFINIYFFEESINFSKDNYGQKPVLIQKSLKEQFQLKSSVTQYTFYKMTANQVVTKDMRFDLFSSKSNYLYFNAHKFIEYEGQPWTHTASVSFDGINFENFTYSYSKSVLIFLDDQFKQHQRQAESIVDLLAKFGGLVSGLISLLSFFYFNQIFTGGDINYNYVMSEFIIKMYYPNQKQNQPKNNKKHSSQFSFNFLELTSDIWWMKPFQFTLQKKKDDNSQYFQQMKLEIEDQMNFINIVRRIQKLSIIITVLLRNPKFEEVKKTAENEYQIQIDATNQEQRNQSNLFEFLDEFGNDLQKNMNALNCQSHLQPNQAIQIIKQTIQPLRKKKSKIKLQRLLVKQNEKMN